MSSNTISTLTVATRIPEAALAKVRAIFETVHYYPDPSKTIPDDVLQSTDIIFTRGRCLPECIVDLERQLPRLRHLQLLSAGSDKFLTSPAIVNYLKQDEGRQLPFTIGNASGVHAVSIAQYIVGCVLSFTNHLVKQIVIAQVRKFDPFVSFFFDFLEKADRACNNDVNIWRGHRRKRDGPKLKKLQETINSIPKHRRTHQLYSTSH